MKRVIRCEEVIPDPIIVTLGDIEVDCTRVSAYNSIRMLKLTTEIENGNPDEEEAWNIIYDIVKEQGQDITEEYILRAGTHQQLGKFISTITSYILRTYKPLEAAVSPSSRLQKQKQAIGQSTSTK